MLTHLNKNKITGLFAFVMIILSTSLFAASNPSIGKVVFVEGEALATKPSGESHNIAINQDIFLKDTLETKNGKLKVLFEDSTLLALEENSKILLTEHIYNPKRAADGRKSIFDVLQGRIRAVVEGVSMNTPSDIQFRTPTAVAGVRGTELGIIVNGKLTTITCFNGLLATYAKKYPHKIVMLPAGMFVVIGDGLPSKPKKITDLLKKLFSYRYLEYPVISSKGYNSVNSRLQGRAKTDGSAGGGVEHNQTTSPELPIILPGGAPETPSLTTPSATGTPAGDPTPFPTPDPSPQPTPEPAPQPAPTPEPAPAPTPDPTPEPTPPAATSPGSVTIPFTFPREG